MCRLILLCLFMKVHGCLPALNIFFNTGIFSQLNLLLERLRDLEQSRLRVTETLLQLQHTQAQQQEQLQCLQQQLENMLQQQVGERPQPQKTSIEEKKSYQNVALVKPSDSVCDPKKNTDYLATLNVLQVTKFYKDT